MKKNRKLHIRTGQELTTSAQEQVLAGGIGCWTGVCRCYYIGDTHVEDMTVEYLDPNWLDIAGGALLTTAAGLSIYYSCGATAAHSAGTLVWGVDKMYDGFTHKSQITYHKRWELRDRNPRTHQLQSEWTS